MKKNLNSYATILTLSHNNDFLLMNMHCDSYHTLGYSPSSCSKPVWIYFFCWTL